MSPPVLRTPRLTLRPFALGDAPAIMRGIGNWDVVRWLSVVPHPYDEADALNYIASLTETGEEAWAICDETGLIGGISIGDELGFWLARPAWRKGYGLEAANAVISHWFKAGGGDLKSGCFVGNHRSEAVLRALGFRQTGRSQRHSVALSQEVEGLDFVLTREAWSERMSFRVETDRLVLRPLTRKDADALCRLAVPEVARNLAGMPTPLLTGEALEIIDARRWRGHVGFHLGIERDGKLIGIVGCGRQPVSIMYAIHPDQWGQGVATEAVAAFLPALFERLPVNRITADFMVDNPASGAVLRKLGFYEVGTGTCRSQARVEAVASITYAITREEALRP